MRRVLVTAGAAGIGREIVAAFLAGGDRVYTCDIDQAALDAAVAALPSLRIGRCDIGDPGQIGRMVADAVAQLGGLDVLVNNAGVAGPTAPVKDVSLEQWRRVLDVDLTGTFLVTKAAIPHLIAAGGGSIITMSSAAGRLGYEKRSPYSTVKWGLIGLAKTLAMELGEHGIRSNAILPGAVDGERIRRVFQARADATGRSFDDVEREAISNQSLKYLVDPKHIAALVVFLASDAGRSISGQTLPIDGDLQRN